MDRVLLWTLVFLASRHSTMGHMIHYRSVSTGNSSMGQRGPTTPYIRDIFIGRCQEDEQCLQQDTCLESTLNGVTCEELWNKFNSSFAYKNPCEADDDDYNELLAAGPPSSRENEALFWSGLPRLALNNGRVTQKHTILEETLPGYILNGLTWCGQPNEPGISYTTPCPSSLVCRNETVYTFWRAASRAFALQARGVIKVALNGSREDAFRNNSTFATNELPNLNPSYVTHVNILLVYDISIPGDNKRARCDEGSINTLQKLLTMYGFSYTCVEDPRDFRFLQCASDPMNEHCIMLNQASLSANSLVLLTMAMMLQFVWV